MAEFKLSDKVNPNKVFILRTSELEKRFDPFYYIPEIKKLEEKVREKDVKPLRHFVGSVSSGATPKTAEKEKYYSDKENGIPFLRVQNLSPTGILEYDDCKYINKETHEGYLKRSQVKGGDLLVKITGVGRMAVASVAPVDFIGNTNQHMVVIKTGNKEVSTVLASYLNTDIGEKLASRRATGGTRPALDYPALLSIPILFDERILTITKKAVDEKNLKQDEAKKLLESIDDYLFDQLGISIPEKDNSLENRIFSSTLNQISGNRFDPDYNLIYYSNFINQLSNIYNTESLRDISINIFQGVGRNQIEFSPYTLLKVKNIKRGNVIDFEDTEFVATVPKTKILIENDIISPFIGEAIRQIKFSIFRLKDNSFTVDNNTGVIRVNSSKAIPNYICELLNSKIGEIQINKLIGGGGVPFLGSQSVKKIFIPLPPDEKQTEISSHIIDLRNQAKQLEIDAAFIMENAKAEIENIILGE